MPAKKLAPVPKPYQELINRFWLRPIRSEEELEQAFAVIDDLTMRDDLTEDEEDYLDLLSDIVEAYEDEHYPKTKVSGIEMVKYLIGQKGVSQSEVARATGMTVSTISDIMNGRRPLNMKHVKQFATYFNVKAGTLMDEVDVPGDDS